MDKINKCKLCGGSLSINTHGELYCPICYKLKRKITVKRTTLNDFSYYKVTGTSNIVVDSFLVQEDIDRFIMSGVSILIK